MQNGIFFLQPLITNISRYTCLVSKLADCVNKISICPKFSSPKLGLYFWVFLKCLFCCYTFQNCNYGRCTHFWNRLNQKMNMIVVCSDLQKVYLISLDYLVGNADQAVDKATLNRLNDINRLAPDDKNLVYAFLDSFITKAKLQSVLR